jgi:hypothetical protein
MNFIHSIDRYIQVYRHVDKTPNEMHDLQSTNSSLILHEKNSRAILFLLVFYQLSVLIMDEMNANRYFTRVFNAS